jgi:hypothetical protein
MLDEMLRRVLQRQSEGEQVFSSDLSTQRSRRWPLPRQEIPGGTSVSQMMTGNQELGVLILGIWSSGCDSDHLYKLKV